FSVIGGTIESGKPDQENLRRLRPRMCGGLIEIGNPSVVTVEPAGVAAAFIPHPGIRTGDSLHNRCARLAMSFVAPEGTLDVFTFYVIKTAGKNSGVLNRCSGSLRHVRRHRMGGITE